MTQLFANNAYSVLASAALSTDTTLALAAGTGSRFPSPSGGDFFEATLIGYDTNGNENAWEVVKCTGRSGDTLTVTRAVDGSTAAAWASAARIEMRAAAGLFGRLAGKAASGANSDITALNALASINGGPLAGMRNRIINGDMRIDQANNGAAVTLNATTLFYLVDMWSAGWVGSAAVATAQQMNNQWPMSQSTLKFTVTTASVPSGNQTYNVQHRLEGLNVADFQFGSSAAKQVTLSFKVRSSLTGQFSGAIQNGAQNRAYPFTFNIAAANTEQDISITIPGDVAGTWAKDNTTGLIVCFDLGGAGIARSTLGTWQAGAFFGVTGSVNLVATNGATFEVTEVQIELGSVATPFERRLGLELTLCQRYFYSCFSIYIPIVTSDATIRRLQAPRPVAMRATPTETGTQGAGGVLSFNGSTTNIGAAVDAATATLGAVIANYTASARL